MGICAVLACLPVLLLSKFPYLGQSHPNPIAHCFLQLGGSCIGIGIVYSLWVEYCATSEKRVLLAMMAFGLLSLGWIAHGVSSLFENTAYASVRHVLWYFFFSWQLISAHLLMVASKTTAVDSKQDCRKTGKSALLTVFIISIFAVLFLIKIVDFWPIILTSLGINNSSVDFITQAIPPDMVARFTTLVAFSAACAMFARIYLRREDKLSEGITLCLMILVISKVIVLLRYDVFDSAWWFAHIYSDIALAVLLIKQGVEFGNSYADAHARIEHLEAVHYVSSRLSNNLDLRVVLLTFVTDAAKTLSARFASILLADDTGETLATIATYGLLEAPLKPSEPHKVTGTGAGFHSGHSARAFRERQICVVDDIYTDVEFIPWRLLSEHDGYAVSIPLICHDIPLGVLNLFFDKHVPLNDERIKLFRTLASSAAVAIANAQLYDNSIRYSALSISEECSRSRSSLAS